MRLTQPTDSKKPYNKPILKLHGEIRALTATVSNHNHLDGGGGGLNRTS
jgi:hypothetical protein